MKVSPRQYLHALKTAHRQASNKTLQHDLKELHDHIEKNRICWASLRHEAGEKQLWQALKDLQAARETIRNIANSEPGEATDAQMFYANRMMARLAVKGFDDEVLQTAPGIAQRGEGDG